MKLTFVGTSHGVPSATRHCSCTMIESGGKVYFIDAGAPMVEAILRARREVTDLRAVFTTHVHSDHTVGMLQLAGLINWHYGKASADFFVTEQSHADATERWLFTAGDGELDKNRIRFKIPSTGIVYEDENIKAEYIPTAHTSKTCSYAVLITEGEKRVLFGGDFSQDLKRADVPRIIGEELDGFVCEMAHFKMDRLAPYLDGCKAKKVFFNHVFPLSNYEDIEKAKGKYPFEVFTPNDDFTIEI